MTKLPLAAVLILLVLAVPVGASRANHWSTRSPWAAPGLALAAASIFAFVLSAKWHAALTTDVLLGGLLPISDAAGYYHGALSFLHLGHLTEWATRRPLSGLVLATLLGLGDGSLRLAVAVLTALAAAGAVLVVAGLGRRLGTGAAIAGGALLLAFFYPTVGTVMSENIGFTLGCCGFVLMWAGTADDRPWLFATGLMLMGFGLVARAGAMFVLPVLALYAGWRFRGSARLSLTWATIAAGAAAIPFMANAAAVRLLGAPDGAAFSNFSYTLYGLATGGHDWVRIYKDVPALADLPSSEQAREAYRLAVEHIAARPFDLVAGIAHTYNDFFVNTRWFAFNGIGSFRLVFAAIALVGLWRLFRHRMRDTESFILAGIVGVWLSVPFIADGGTRVHAATVPFTAAVIALGVATALSRFGKDVAPLGKGTAVTSGAGVLATIVLAGMVLAPAFRDTDALPPLPAECPPGATPVALATAPGAHLDIVNDETRASGRRFAITQAAFAAGRVWPGQEPDAVAGLAPPVRLGLALNLAGTGSRWIVSPAGLDLPARFGACGIERGPFLYLDRAAAPRR